jgi:hypothetical protein
MIDVRRTLFRAALAMLALALLAAVLLWSARRSLFRIEQLTATDAGLHELELARDELFSPPTFRALVERLLHGDPAWTAFLERLDERAAEYARASGGHGGPELEPPPPPAPAGDSVVALLRALDAPVSLPDATDLAARLAELPSPALTTRPVALRAALAMQRTGWVVRLTLHGDDEALRAWQRAGFAPAQGAVAVVATAPAKAATPRMIDWDAALHRRGTGLSLATWVRWRGGADAELAQLAAGDLSPELARTRVREALGARGIWRTVAVAGSFAVPLLAFALLTMLAIRLAAAARAAGAVAGGAGVRGDVSVRRSWLPTAATCGLALATAALPIALGAGWRGSQPVPEAFPGTLAVLLLAAAAAATCAAVARLTGSTRRARGPVGAPDAG